MRQGWFPEGQVSPERTTYGIFCSGTVLENCIVGSVLSDGTWNEAGSWAKSLTRFGKGADNALLLHEEQCQKGSQLERAVSR